MCMPIPSTARALDHFGIVDRELRLYIAVGSNHPPNGFVAYLKYVPSTDPQPWRLAGSIYMRRVLPRYSPRHADIASRPMRRVYMPTLGCFVPIVGVDSLAELIDPRNVARRLLHHCRDELECIALELIESLASVGAELANLGVTGSIMFGIHNPRISDIDLVVYVEDRDLARYLEAFQSILDPLPAPRLEAIVRGVAELHALPLDLARLVYAVPRRGVYRGREITVVYADPRPLPLAEVIDSTCVDVVMHVEAGQSGFLKYPGHGVAERVVVDGRALENVHVLSYEAAYSIPLYFGGVYRCRALLQRLVGEEYRIVLGSRECHTYITLSHSLPK